MPQMRVNKSLEGHVSQGKEEPLPRMPVRASVGVLRRRNSMWLHIPKTALPPLTGSPSVPESEDWNSVCISRNPDIELFVTSSGKPSLRPLSWHGWKTRPWIRLLSGLTFKTFNGRPWCGCVDILTAGYPCQPFSTSGKRRADQDPRHLWPEVARIIRETQPDQVFLENVAGHLDLGFDQVARDLEEMGFDVEADLFTALEVGASHRRERLFILADTNRQHSGELSVNGACRGTSLPAPQFQRTSDWDRQPKQGLDTLVGSADGFRLDAEQLPLFAPGPDAFEAWHGILESRPDLKPAVSRNVDGMEDRVDRSAAAGNGVSSLVAAYAYRTLKARLCG